VATARNGSKVESVRAQLIRLVAAAGEGERMPAERELCAAWGVARMTLRRALDELVAEGLLVRRQGQGTFVARPRMARHLSVKSFTDQMRQQGRVPSSRVLEFRRIRAGVAQARQLRLPVGDPIVRFTRLRLADDEPIGLETTCVSAALVPDLAEADLDESWYELLASRYSLQILHGTSLIEPVALTQREARALETTAGRPAFRIETSTFGVGGRVIDFEVDVYRGDRYSLTADLRPEPASPPHRHRMRARARPLPVRAAE
jgi:DNA-binding GntR family transcriptional regulator